MSGRRCKEQMRTWLSKQQSHRQVMFERFQPQLKRSSAQLAENPRLIEAACQSLGKLTRYRQVAYKLLHDHTTTSSTALHLLSPTRTYGKAYGGIDSWKDDNQDFVSTVLECLTYRHMPCV